MLTFFSKYKWQALLFLTITFGVPLQAQKESNDVRSGNKQYKAGKFTDAEVSYRKGLIKNNKSFEANYNLGNALFRQEKYSEAFEQYQNATALQKDDKTKLAAALHNTGNALLAEKKIEESIQAYKNALKANPSDNDTRYNLAYAQSLLKKQQQKNEDKKDDKNQQKEQEKPEQKPQPQPQQPKMSKENAQQILQALEQDEKNTMEKAKKQAAKGRKSAEKDW